MRKEFNLKLVVDTEGDRERSYSTKQEVVVYGENPLPALLHELGHVVGSLLALPTAQKATDVLVQRNFRALFAHMLGIPFPPDSKTNMQAVLAGEIEAWNHAQVMFDSVREWALDTYRKGVDNAI